MKLQVPAYMRPHRYIFLREMPLTENGKIARDVLEVPTTPPDSVSRIGEGPLEEGLRALFEEVLGVAQIEPEDDFFELGGDSLSALQMLLRVEAKIGTRVPMDAFYGEPTVEHLARLIEESRGAPVDAVLVPLRPGTGPALYCMPTENGEVQVYRGLVEELSADQAVFGARLSGSRLAVRGRFTDIESIARTFTAKIVEHNPKGPYFLLGYSWSGLLAYEVSRQLLIQGHQVAFVGMIGTRPRFRLRDDVWRWVLVQGRRVRRVFAPAELVSMLRRVGRRALTKTVANTVPPPATGGLAEHFFALSRTYSPGRPSPKDIYFFRDLHDGRTTRRAFEEKDELWRRWTGANVHLHWVGGDHYSCMRPPHVAAMAAVLRQAIADSIE